MLRCYAVHYHSLNFTLFKLDSNVNQLRTANCKTKAEAISAAFSKEIANNLENFSVSDDSIGLEAEAFFTNANFSGKKIQFILFINDRMVHVKALKAAVESVFSDYMAKGSYPWERISKISSVFPRIFFHFSYNFSSKNFSMEESFWFFQFLKKKRNLI